MTSSILKEKPTLVKTKKNIQNNINSINNRYPYGNKMTNLYLRNNTNYYDNYYANSISTSEMPWKIPSCPCGGGCPRCQLEAENDVDVNSNISRKASTMSKSKTNDKVTNEISNVRSSIGSPLNDDTKEIMESRFGYDFSSVRIHTDMRAAKSARLVNASAYTVGQDIVFGLDQYLPRTKEGQRLIAHELSHVIQQSRRGHLFSYGTIHDNTLEQAANDADSDFVYGSGLIKVKGTSTFRLARQPLAYRRSMDPEN